MTPLRPRAVPPGLGAPLAAAAVVSVVAVAAVGVVVAGTSAPNRLDRWVAGVVSDMWPEPGLVAYAIDFLGVPWVVAAVAAGTALLAAGLGRRRLAVVAVLAPAASGLFATLGKSIVGRTIHGDNLSYPSGHVAAATTLAAVLALLIVDLFHAGRVVGTVGVLVGALAFGCVMAVDQIAISAHYPTDALGGLATAVAVVVLVAAGVDRGADLAARHRVNRSEFPR